MPVGLSLPFQGSRTDRLSPHTGLPLHLRARRRRPRHRYPFSPPPVPLPYSLTLSTNTITSGNFALLPLRTKTRGPAYTLPALPASTSVSLGPDPDSPSYDPLDEVLSLFRANTFFRNFEIKGPADRLLIYGILFVSECLGKLKPTMAAREAEKALTNLAVGEYSIPGEPGFAGGMGFEGPARGDRGDAEILRGYIGQVRQELAARLLGRVYGGGDVPSKVCS